MATLTNLSVSFISLVRAPATGKPLTLKSAAGERGELIRIAKTDDERMMAFGIVYAPNQADSHGDQADAATIRRAAYEFMREGRARNVDREHSFTPEMAYVAESWIVRAADPLFPEEPEGAWAVGIQIGDPDIWKALKAGELAGISLAGVAHAQPDPAPQPQWTEKGVVAWLKSLLTTTTPTPEPEETPMNKTEVEEAVRGILKAELPALLKDALKADAPPANPAPAPAPANPAPAPANPTPAVDDARDAEVTALKNAVAALEDKFAIVTAKGVTETGLLAKSEETYL